jgi:hypothetical protein
MKIFKDPVWQFVGVVVAVIALIATVIIYLIDRPVKRLQVQILSNSPLISVNTDISSQIQILYNDKPVQSLSLILLRFENVGNEPIKETDYSEPIRILLSPQAEVGEVSVQETKPEGIDLNPKVSATNQIEIAKTLLNPGDQVVIKVLALNNDGTLEVKARIAGISNLEILSALESSAKGNDSASNERLFIMLLVSTIIVIFGSIFIWNSTRVVEWRKSHLGFDPARHYYTRAQETILSKDKDTGNISNAISYLRAAFSWDSGYVQKAQRDPLFSHLQEYENFKAMIDKYKQNESDENNTSGGDK